MPVPGAPDYTDRGHELAQDARSSDNAAEGIAHALNEAWQAGDTHGYNLAVAAEKAQRDLEGPSLTLDAAQLFELRRLVGSMPYGASLPRLFPRPRIGEYATPAPTGPDLIRYLTGLRDRLVQAVESREANERALFELRAQRAAFRDFLGLPVDGMPIPAPVAAERAAFEAEAEAEAGGE